MFTPRSTPSASPLLKDELESLFSDVNLTILRQLMNDCGVPGALKPSPIEILAQSSDRFLLNDHILSEHRASTLLFDSLTKSRHGTHFIRSITAGFLRSITQNDDQIRAYVHILALLASETGRGELLGASVLSTLVVGQPEIVQGIVYGLVRTILGAGEYCLVAEATLSFVLEHPESRRLGREMLMHAVLEDLKLAELLRRFLWERLLNGDLMAEFILFRILHGNDLPLQNDIVEKIMSLTKLLQSDSAAIGKYPNVYLHLCLLHTVLNNGETLNSLSISWSPRTISKGWFSPKPNPEPDFEFVLATLLDLMMENLRNQRDLYQHSVLVAILTNIFVDQGQRCTELMLKHHEKYEITNFPSFIRLRECSILLPGNVQIELNGMVDLWVSRTTSGDPKSPTFEKKTKLQEENTAAAFFLPLIHATLFHSLNQTTKSVC